MQAEPREPQGRAPRRGGVQGAHEHRAGATEPSALDGFPDFSSLPWISTTRQKREIQIRIPGPGKALNCASTGILYEGNSVPWFS